MMIPELQKLFIDELRPMLPDWKFVASRRHFRMAVGDVNWLFHIAFVNHPDDFDVIGDVSVEFMKDRQRCTILGAQLGNIAGVGQTRHSIRSSITASNSANSLITEFREIGLPFLARFSNVSVALSVLESGGQEAVLISPFKQFLAGQILALRQLALLANDSSVVPSGATER